MKNVIKIVNRKTGVTINFLVEDFHFSIENNGVLASRSELSCILNSQPPMDFIDNGGLKAMFKEGNQTQTVTSKLSIMDYRDVIEISDCEDEHHTVRMIISKYAKKNARKYKTKSIDNVLYVKRIQ